MPVLMITATVLLALDHRKHRRDGLDHRPAFPAAIADTAPAAVRKLTAHEPFLPTSFLRWVTRRGPHGVRAGDLPAPYAPGQAAVTYGFLFDGSLRLRYGAQLDVRIPADRIASVRLDRQFPGDKLAAVNENDVTDTAVASQTTTTVKLTEPVRYIRALGKPAEARMFRMHAADPASAVAALRAGRSAGGTSVVESADRSRTLQTLNSIPLVRSAQPAPRPPPPAVPG
ncbi:MULTISPECIES: hypothetical protein [Streptomyces]|uniref:hypothetical protein n=1 Tax=Streptomyces TaxID=1883 RepID=UPI001F182D5F|nr:MULTISPECIES: hypothetical protein [Streptomyces]